MTKCPKCGAEIKYIPMTDRRSNRGAVMVEPEYTEMFLDSGRTAEGHLRHKCPEKEAVKNE